MSRRPLLILAALALAACTDDQPASDAQATIPDPPAAEAPPAQPSADAAEEPRFYVTYSLDRTGDNRRPFRLSEARKILYDSKLLETLANAMNQTVVLPRKIGIVAQNCEQDLAYYDPRTVSIHICDQLVGVFWDSFRSLPTEQDRLDATVLATGFSMLHEISHALIDQYQLAILGAEEDAADAMATVLLMSNPALEVIAQRGADGLRALDVDPAHPIYWDEHSVGEQRFYDINCLIYGSDPAAHEWLVTGGVLPPQRAQRCEREWEQKSRGVQTLLEPHRRAALTTLGAPKKPILTRIR